jgi:sortase A
MRARRREFGQQLLSCSLLAGGALLAFFGLRDLIQWRTGQVEASRQFETVSLVKPSPFNTAPRPSTPQLGDAIAKLVIPRLDAEYYVVEGDGVKQLLRGPGHLRGSAMPGANGNCVIAAHRDTHFRVLKDIRDGDEIVLQTRGGEYTYRVRGTRIVPPSNTKSLRPTSDAELHLVTCYPFYYLGPAPKRFVVEASLERRASVLP